MEMDRREKRLFGVDYNTFGIWVCIFALGMGRVEKKVRRMEGVTRFMRSYSPSSMGETFKCCNVRNSYEH